jgi:hypothetical protein
MFVPSQAKDDDDRLLLESFNIPDKGILEKVL